MPTSRPHFLVFGEMLWDLLPTGKKPGGAPMNVALRLHALGAKVDFVSRVGEDDLGEALESYLESQRLPTALIQRDSTHPTGTVGVDTSDPTEVRYDIHAPAAWDHIEHEEAAYAAARAAHAVVYQSLAARGKGSRKSLEKLLEAAQFAVLDVNLRAPYYDEASLGWLLHRADLLKINHHELDHILAYTGENEGSLSVRLQRLHNRYDIPEIVLTRGANGAVFSSLSGSWVEHSGYRVEVVDTIGSGDTFLAAFIHRYLGLNHTPADALDFACALGALVATHAGANPDIQRETVDALQKKD